MALCQISRGPELTDQNSEKAGKNRCERLENQAGRNFEAKAAQLKEKQEQLTKRADRKRICNENVISELSKYGGLWTTETQMNKELDKLQRDAQKKAAVKAQLSVRKKILGQKALTPSVFAFSAKGEQFPLTQLVENLASPLSNPQDIDPECVQQDKCLQQRVSRRLCLASFSDTNG